MPIPEAELEAIFDEMSARLDATGPAERSDAVTPHVWELVEPVPIAEGRLMVRRT